MKRRSIHWLRNLEPGCLLQWTKDDESLLLFIQGVAQKIEISLGLDAEIENCSGSHLTGEDYVMYLDAQWVTWADSFDEYVKIRVLQRDKIGYILFFDKFQHSIDLLHCMPHLTPEIANQYLVIFKPKPS